MKPVLKGLKEIDYKDFLLHHGQWVALGVGAVFLVPLLILGASSAVTSDSPAATAKGINDLASGVEKQMRTGPASPGVTAEVEDRHAGDVPAEYLIDLGEGDIGPDLQLAQVPVLSPLQDRLQLPRLLGQVA